MGRFKRYRVNDKGWIKAGDFLRRIFYSSLWYRNSRNSSSTRRRVARWWPPWQAQPFVSPTADWRTGGLGGGADSPKKVGNENSASPPQGEDVPYFESPPIRPSASPPIRTVGLSHQSATLPLSHTAPQPIACIYQQLSKGANWILYLYSTNIYKRNIITLWWPPWRMLYIIKGPEEKD